MFEWLKDGEIDMAGNKISLREVMRGEPTDLPVDLEDLIDEQARAQMQSQLDRIARTRREVQTEAAALRMG